MNKTFVSLITAAVVITGLLVFQMTRATSAFDMLPSEVYKSDQKVARIRVAGRVSSEPIEYVTKPKARLTFYLEDPPTQENSAPDKSEKIKVIYEGLRPDMFDNGRDVIVDGEFTGEVLLASSLLTQCPSKYEPPTVEDQYLNEGDAK